MGFLKIGCDQFYITYLLNQRETFSSRHLRVTVILSSLYDIASQGYNYIVTRYLATYITFIDRVCNDSSCEDWKFFDFVRVQSWMIRLPGLASLRRGTKYIYLALFEDRLTIWGIWKVEVGKFRGDDCKIYCCKLMRFQKNFTYYDIYKYVYVIYQVKLHRTFTNR